MNPIQTPRSLLLEAANNNPGQILLASMVNGQISCQINFQNTGDAMLMLFILQEKLRELLLEILKKNTL